MKMILAGSLSKRSSTVSFMKKTLERLGHEIVLFDYRAERERHGNQKMQEMMVDLTGREKPDIFLLVKGEGIFPSIIQKIKEVAHVSLRYMDSPIPSWLVRLGRVADSFFVTAGGLVAKYRRLGFKNVYHLWEGCDPEVHRYVESDLPCYQCDIAFIGTNKVGRQRLLTQIENRGFQLKIWGSASWPSNLPYQGELVGTEDFARVCSGARIVLGLNDNNAIADYFSDRTFLTLACRGFHLTPCVPGLEKWFTNKEHLVWFNIRRGWLHRYEECIDLIDYYLDRPEERARIAEAGQKHVYKNYTWQHSMEKMVGILSQLIKRR
ncbi:glycosyltransferase [bacterium]|nr:glycosyltransferase [bacterium]